MSLLKHRYSAIAIALHWIIAFAILGMIGLGWYMGDLPNTATNKADLYQLHKSIGVSIFILTIARILWRIINKPPEEVPMEHMQAVASRAVHFGFYMLMILMPLTGWILVSASAYNLPTLIFDTFQWPHLPFLPDLSTETKKSIFPVLENAHGKLAWVAIVLLLLHVAGAVKHQFIDKDGVMARMLPGIFGSTDGPHEQPKGVLMAFGGAAAVFAIIVGLGMFFDKANAQQPPTAEPTAAQTEVTKEEESAAPNWSINKEESKIGFSGIYNKKPFEGLFENWNASIYFDPDAPAKAGVKVTVDTASAKTGDNYNDKSLAGADFLDVKQFPEAIFKATGAFEVESGIELTAVLTLKGQDFPVRMPFSLDITDDQAVMTSSFTLDRIALGLGLENDANADWVSKEIQMDVQVVASRIQ